MIGRVAELDAVPKAVARAGPMDPMNLEVGEVELLLTRCLCGCYLNGSFRVIRE